MKNLYRSKDNRIFAGIFGGLGEYYNIDPVLLRAGFVFVVLITGLLPGILAYIICRYIIPANPTSKVRDAEFTENVK